MVPGVRGRVIYPFFEIIVTKRQVGSNKDTATTTVYYLMLVVALSLIFFSPHHDRAAQENTIITTRGNCLTAIPKSKGMRTTSRGQTTKTDGETYFCNSHSRLSRGQTFLVFSQREMQWKWKACWETISVILSPEEGGNVRCKYPKLHYTLHWWLKPD
jgi:hypothetical protein